MRPPSRRRLRHTLIWALLLLALHAPSMARHPEPHHIAWIALTTGPGTATDATAASGFLSAMETPTP